MNHLTYQQYTSEEFARDNVFIDWVLDQKEDSFWQTYIGQHPQQEDEIKLARQIILSSRSVFAQHRWTDSELQDMRQSLLSSIQHTNDLQSESRILSIPVWSRWAASIALLFAFGIGWYVWNEDKGQVKYETAYGEIQLLELPDGSHVNLHANSTLRFDQEWEEGEDRKVELEGEAYFEVEKKPSTHAKFTVYTPDLNIEVLGTEFNVNSRNEQTQVVLNEGKINLKLSNHEQDSILMKPGDLVAFSRAKQTLEVKQVNPTVLTSWKEGIQLFEKAPLLDVLKKMEEIYGIAIELRNKELVQRHLTIGIPVQNLQIAFESLENILGTTVTQKNTNTYWLE